MRKFSIALAAAMTLGLAACGGGEEATNNVTAAEDLNLTDPLATDMNAMDMNAMDMNAMDMNAMDMNAMDMNATDVNATDLNAL